jgi:hypothetical protein
MQELGSDAVVQADAARDILNVGADLFGEIRDLVDEGYFGGEKCVGGILIISAVRRPVNIRGAWFSDKGR